MIQTLILLIGFVFISRTNSKFFREQKLPKSFLILVLRATIFFNMILSIFHWLLPEIVVCLLLIFEIIVIHKLEIFYDLYLRRQFPSELLKFIDELALLMSAGRPYRDAFTSMSQQKSGYFVKKILEIQKSSQLNNQNSLKQIKDEPKFLELWQLFKSLEQNSHKQLEQIRAFRRQLLCEQNFRRKSSQATSQVKAQAIVLSILYIALLIYILQTNQGKIIHWILISLTLYFSGLLSLYILGKPKRWKT